MARVLLISPNIIGTEGINRIPPRIGIAYLAAAFPAMQKAALSILKNGRAKEADDLLLPIKEILTIIK